MKKLRFFFICIIVSSVFFGCRLFIVDDYDGTRVVVDVEPPEVIIESPPPSPGPRWVWREGHWRWNGRRYVWARGHWTKIPRKRYKRWVPGHWERHGRHWHWAPGHWR